MKRQQNRRLKDQANETVATSKLSAQQKREQVAMETKAEKEATRMRNEE